MGHFGGEIAPGLAATPVGTGAVIFGASTRIGLNGALGTGPPVIPIFGSGRLSAPSGELNKAYFVFFVDYFLFWNTVFGNGLACYKWGAAGGNYVADGYGGCDERDC